MTLLELKNVSVAYGRIEAIHDMSFSVEEGEIVSLIGANGAGKSTTMKTISGLLNPSKGSITFDGQDITKMKAHIRVVQGISQAPEGRGIFPGMTVLENLDMGAFGRKDRSGMDADFDRVFSLFPRLAERKTQVGGTMSGGEQQMLAIGRALMSAPRLLLLDEPSMGLAPQFIKQIFSIITRDQRSRGRPSCWSSRTPTRRSPARTAASCSRPARSPTRAPARSSSPTPPSRRPTSASADPRLEVRDRVRSVRAETPVFGANNSGLDCVPVMRARGAAGERCAVG